MKHVKLVLCLIALSNMLTGPFLDSARGVIRLSKPFAAIDTTNCVPNSPTVWFAAITGDDRNDGKTPQTPTTVYGAAQAALPGHRVCVMGGTYPETGTFYPPRSGTPSAWIVYQAYGDGPVNVVWTPTTLPCPPAGTADCTMVNAIPQNGNSYLEFRGFTFYGRGLAGDAFGCHNSHHLRYIGNTIYDVQGAAVAAVQCDYVISDHNIVYHGGYSGTTASWTSGISYNQIQAFDCSDGLHNVISNNIVVGQYDNSPNHSDGSGFILDIDSTPSACSQTAARYEPAALISNNVAYGNGGRCAEAFLVSFLWIMMNNTCYTNNLDSVDANQANTGSLSADTANNGYFVNNISVSQQRSNPPYEQRHINTNIQYFQNVSWGGPCYADSSGTDFCANNSQFVIGDPKFVASPYFDPTATGQYALAAPPFLLDNGLTPQLGSPAYCQGVDPSTLPGVPAQVAADMKNPNNVYTIYRDFNGNARPGTGGCWDLGAYQH